MAEGAALEMPCTLSGYRGFESRPLRQTSLQPSHYLFAGSYVWLPTLKYARTIHDADCARDPGQFKLRMVCITSRAAS